jgi:hypothetical protein
MPVMSAGDKKRNTILFLEVYPRQRRGITQGDPHPLKNPCFGDYP